VQSSSPGPFTLTAETPVCDPNPPAPSPAVRLDWTLSADASTYDVYRNGSLSFRAVSGLTFYNNANVVAGQTYTYFVRARNSVGTKDSNVITVSIASNICQQSTISLNSVGISPSTVSSGGSATITVTLSGAAPSPNGALVSASSSNPSLLSPPPTVTVQPGQTSASTTIGVGTVSTSTTVTLTASYAGSTSNATVTITPPASSLAISSVSITPSNLSSGAFATLSVTLNGIAPAGGAVVAIQTSDSTALPAPTTITVPPGQSTNGVSVQAGAVSNPKNVTVTATYGGATQSASVTINPSAGNQVLVSLTSWQPQFTLGDPPASIGVRINSQTGALTGTIAANSSWLTAAGHSSYSWVAPETVNITANPAGMSAGTYTGSLTVTAPAASNSPVSISVTMTILTPLQIITTSLPLATWGQSYSQQLYATGGNSYTWSLQSGSSLPPNLTLSASGLISGTLVQASSTNTYSFTVLVTDDRSRTQYANLSMKVQAPIAVSTNAPSSFQFIVGQSYVEPPNGNNSISFFATGGTSPYAWAASGTPPGLRIDTATGYIIGTPTQQGTFSTTVTATDSTGRSGSGSFSLIVTMTPLVITSANSQPPPVLPSGTTGVPYNGYLGVTGGSNSGYQWNVTGFPPGLTGQVVTPSSCGFCSYQISGTPAQAATYTLSVKVTDSLNNTATASVTLVINSGTPPTITTTTLTLATVGGSYSFPFAATGGTPPYQWSFIGSPPDPGLQLTSAGVLEGTSSVPNDCYTGPAFWVGNQPPFGSFTPAYFQVKVTDSAGQSTNKQFCLPAYYPTPTVSGFTPSSVVLDNQAHAITVNGTNFRSNSVLYGIPSAPTFVNNTALSFVLSPNSNSAYGIGEGSHNIWVVQPYSYTSNQDKAFTIYDPVPTVSGASAVLNNSSQPCRANFNCQLIISGTGFVPSTQYQVAGNGVCVAQSPSTAFPWTSVTTCAFTVPSTGSYTLKVTNSNQPGGTPASATYQFSVSQ
jgi:hypothetical protein